jgi:hypothetical protein
MGIGDIFTPATSTYTAKAYQPNESRARIGSHYSNQLAYQIAGAQGRSTPTATAAQVNTGQSDQARTQQMQLADMLRRRATGGAPSQAELQMRQGMGQAIAGQASMAASARGMTPAQAQRLAAQNAAGITGNVAAQTAQMRAGEQAQAEQALGGVLGGVRGQDIGVATSQAGLEQQAGLANQGAELQNRAQMDAAMAQYLSMGMSREEAQARAMMELEQMRAQQSLGVQQINAQTASGNANAENQGKILPGQLIGGGLSAIGSVAALGVASDRRAKRDIKPADTKGFLDALRSYSYHYRDEGKHGEGERLGIMAQDLEKTATGKHLVKPDAEGVKRVDVGGLALALAGAASDMHRRLSKIEGKR